MLGITDGFVIGASTIPYHKQDIPCPTGPLLPFCKIQKKP